MTSSLTSLAPLVGHACLRCALMVVVLWPVAAAAQPWVATDIFEVAGVTVTQLHTSGPAVLAAGRLH